MFSNYKKIEDLEDAYDTAKKKIDIELQNLNEQRFQLKEKMIKVTKRSYI